jgi:hypothetical protein
MRQNQSARFAMSERRGSTTMSFVPAFWACLKNVAATGWFAVVFDPVISAAPAFAMSP